MGTLNLYTAPVVAVWAIIPDSLLPFFALGEIGRIIGEGRLWNLMSRPRALESTDLRRS